MAAGNTATPQKDSAQTSEERARIRRKKAQQHPFGRLMSSRPIIALVGLVASLCLMCALVAGGLAVCILPPSTTALANATVMEQVSPFDHDQLVRNAQAVRDYSFGAHSQDELYATMKQINCELLEGQTVKRPGAPDLGLLETASSTLEIKAALQGASDRYALDQDAVSHLDDVYNVAFTALVVIVLLMLLGVAALAHLVYYRGVTGIWKPLAFSGGFLLAAFAALGIWAALDFYGLFGVFHSLFFSEGTWTFSYESLLICSLPTEFWMGMGGIWLAVTCALAVCCLGVGLKLRTKALSGALQ